MKKLKIDKVTIKFNRNILHLTKKEVKELHRMLSPLIDQDDICLEETDPTLKLNFNKWSYKVPVQPYQAYIKYSGNYWLDIV